MRCTPAGATTTRPKSYTGAPAAVRLAKRTTAGWSLSRAAEIPADSRVGGQHLRTLVPDSRAWRPPSCPEWRPHRTYRQSGCGHDEPEGEREVEPQPAAPPGRRRIWRSTDRTGTPGRRTRRTTMTNGILRFNTNSPVEVALRWDDGKRVEGRYGEQVMYSLEGDRVMYVPPVVAQQIRELGIRAREIFEICKAELREENKRWIEWRVRRIEEPRHPASSDNVSEAAALGPNNDAQNHRNGSTHQTARPLDLHASPDGTLLPVPVTGAGITAMELAMSGAAEVAQRVESRARMRNYSLQFTSEDIRAIGLTMFIQAMRERGVT